MWSRSRAESLYLEYKVRYLERIVRACNSGCQFLISLCIRIFPCYLQVIVGMDFLSLAIYLCLQEYWLPVPLSTITLASVLTRSSAPVQYFYMIQPLPCDVF